MNNICAFADEYGTNSFDFEKVGTHFIVASIVVDRAKQAALEDSLDEIRRRNFQKGEIKSLHVRGNHNRRVRILKELLALDFTIYALVVDKKRLYGEGFRYKKSFYKFVNGLLYQELFKTFPNLELTVDEHGSNDFMRGFRSYVEKQHIPTLFSGSQFHFSNSTASPLVQLSDFIVGTLGYVFDEQKRNSNSQQLFELLQPRLSGIKYFPNNFRDASIAIAQSNPDTGFHQTIADLSVNLAKNFIEETQPDSQEEIDQINCVRLLLLYLTSYNPQLFVSTKELIRNLSFGRPKRLTEHTFRTKVVAKIRDTGVLIASSSAGEKTGYKLPCSKDDLYRFVSHGSSVIVPMLARIDSCRKQIKLATQNEVDILDDLQFIALKKLLDRS